MKAHKWIPSTLGHGKTMCAWCKGTNRELAALGEMEECKSPPSVPDALRYLDNGGIAETLGLAFSAMEAGAGEIQMGTDMAIALCQLASERALEQATAPRSLDATLTLGLLREANISRNAEWDPEGKLTLTFRATELSGEIGEACNVVKKLEREALGLRGSRATVEQLAEELADGLICIDLLAMQAGVDLSSAVIAKFNAASQKNGLSILLPTRSEDGEPA